MTSAFPKSARPFSSVFFLRIGCLVLGLRLLAGPRLPATPLAATFPASSWATQRSPVTVEDGRSREPRRVPGGTGARGVAGGRARGRRGVGERGVRRPGRQRLGEVLLLAGARGPAAPAALPVSRWPRLGPLPGCPLLCASTAWARLPFEPQLVATRAVPRSC